MTLASRLKPFLTTRFLKFGAVGASGVVVNLGALWALRNAGLVDTAASALAIELSILSNFAFNELWTFTDRRDPGQSAMHRCLRFQLVSLVGAGIQWTVFVAANVGLLWWLDGALAVGSYFGSEGDLVRYIARPVVSPPDIGAGVYLSQLAGIAVATGWNFLANFHWTWGRDEVG